MNLRQIYHGLGVAAGLLFLSVASTGANAQNLVNNPGFETGDFTGWALSGNSGFVNVTGNPTYVHTGDFGASFGAVGSQTFLTQTIATNAGSLYDLDFWLHNDGGTPSLFTVSWNGISLLNQGNGPATVYDEFTFTGLAATGPSTNLVFGFRQDPAFFGLDDVSVTTERNNNLGITPEGSSLAMLSMGLLPLAYGLKRRFRRA